MAHENKWGFRKERSTKGFLLHLTETWKEATDNGYYVGVIFVNFKKAFDSVNRDILKRKLQAVGICGNLYQWLCNYLNDRNQFANVNSKHSSVKIIVFGVP